MTLDWFAKNGSDHLWSGKRGCDGVRSLLITVTVKGSISRAGRRATKARKPSLLWKIKNEIQCLQIALEGNS